MGRRLAGGFLVAIGLIVASLAWVGFSFTHTILDPGRSQAIADDLYDDPEVRAQLKSSMTSAMQAALPEGMALGRPEIADAADRALHDPAVKELLVGGLVRAHQRFLGADPNPDEPIVVDGSALAAATRSQLINAHPELLGAVPEVPSLAITLPTDSIPDAGGLRSTISGAVVMLATLAAGLVAAAFIVTDNRARILRRVGFWAIGAAAFWLVIGFVLPALAHLLLPGQAAIIAAIWGVAANGMLQPSIIAAVAGVAALVLSLVWMAGSSVSGRRRPERHPMPRQAPPRTRTAPLPHAPRAPDPDAYGPRAPRHPIPVRTPGPATPATGVPVVPPPAAARPAAPTWIEGKGYVDDPDTTRPS
ncbi:MAG: hypothetical protein JJE52_09385 [Acidimicrobiia bacterium]|nr:hypothetical protein [Acidimicrobiia bacterium]